MRRKDSKYIFHKKLLPTVLEKLKNDYKALEINGERVMEYETEYFDTPDFLFYHLHHNCRLNRYKIRKRDYLNSHESFLEVKFKSNKRITEKNRLKIDSEDIFDEENVIFVEKNSHISLDNLESKLFNSFHRITLANFACNERITFDLDLSYRNRVQSASLNNLAICELKQDAYGSVVSPVKNILKSLSIHPFSISKYCIGTVLLNPEIKQNRFKSKLLTINKISNG